MTKNPICVSFLKTSGLKDFVNYKMNTVTKNVSSDINQSRMVTNIHKNWG